MPRHKSGVANQRGPAQLVGRDASSLPIPMMQMQVKDIDFPGMLKPFEKLEGDE